MKKIKDILSGTSLNINHFISSESPVEIALRKAATSFSKALFVVENENIVGIFSIKDFFSKISTESTPWLLYKVNEFMSTRIPTISCDASLNETLQVMQQNYFSCIAVTENNQIVGVVNIDYLIEQTLEEKNFLIDQMMSYINGDISSKFENVITEFIEYQNVELPIILPEEFEQNAA